MLARNKSELIIFTLLMQDVLINTSALGSGGRLYNRFRYLRNKDKKTSSPVNGELQSSVNEQPEFSPDDLLYLKTTLISDSNIGEVRKRLEKTRKKRDEMVKDEETDLLEQFPFFFTCPQLVSN